MPQTEHSEPACHASTGGAISRRIWTDQEFALHLRPTQHSNPGTPPARLKRCFASAASNAIRPAAWPKAFTAASWSCNNRPSTTNLAWVPLLARPAVPARRTIFDLPQHYRCANRRACSAISTPATSFHAPNNRSKTGPGVPLPIGFRFNLVTGNRQFGVLLSIASSARPTRPANIATFDKWDSALLGQLPHHVQADARQYAASGGDTNPRLPKYAKHIRRRRFANHSCRIRAAVPASPDRPAPPPDRPDNNASGCGI